LKFIVDQQLPPILAAWLRDQGFDALHAREAGLRDAEDAAIWAWAEEAAAIVISKDQDFVQLKAARGGPRLVWVRVGNCDNPTLIARFEQSWAAIAESLGSGDEVVELR
jgi:predicted nuclease of predicted toxin-antitoxin system